MIINTRQSKKSKAIEKQRRKKDRLEKSKPGEVVMDGGRKRNDAGWVDPVISVVCPNCERWFKRKREDIHRPCTVCGTHQIPLTSYEYLHHLPNR